MDLSRFRTSIKKLGPVHFTVDSFLTEDEITEVFTDYLVGKNWKILSRAKGKEKGSDIVAEREGEILCIEAKGGGSQN